MKYGNLIVQSWHETQEGREFMSSILHRNRRKAFGILDNPTFPPHLKPDEASYKIILCGKSGVGKTSIISKLCGREVAQSHFETPGIDVSNVYWPAKLVQTKQILLFKFTFWDAGEQAWKKFDHIPVAMKRDADCVFFVFSLTNKSTWEDIPSLISRTELEDDVAKVVVGTRVDQVNSIEVNDGEIQKFANSFQIPVLTLANVDGPKLADGKHLDGRASIQSTAAFLNKLTEMLWYRDQLAAGIVKDQTDNNASDEIILDPKSNISNKNDYDDKDDDNDDINDRLSMISNQDKYKVSLC